MICAPPVGIIVYWISDIMKVYFIVMLLIAVQLTRATLTLDKITEKVHAGLKTLKDRAVNKLHKLKQEIDLKKLHQHDVHHLLPYAHKHYIHEHYSKKTPLVVDHHHIANLKHHFEPHHKPAPIHYHHFEHFAHV